MSATSAATDADTRDEIPVDNPATGGIAGHVADMTNDVPTLVARARTAQRDWAARPIKERAGVVAAMRRWLVENRARVVESTMRETGKTYEDALLNEVFVPADSLRFWEKKAEGYLKDDRVRTPGPMVLGRKFIVRRRPLGVVGVIAPWNYPLTIGLGDAVPALIAGNTVVLKPSEITPLTTKMVVEAFARETDLPEDVLMVATGRGDTGAALVDHVDMVMFTGSTRTGRRVAARAAERLIPVALEMGGKDPMIVCADADLDRAANAATTMGLLNSGQICLSVERIYVEDEVHDAFVERLVSAVGKLRQHGLTAPGEADVGAMTFPPQIETVERHVADALDKGAIALTGGKRGEGPGLYYEPTVLVNVNHDMACMREETFGPTLPVMRVSDVDEAVRLANDSVYGLGSSVFTKDLAKGESIARRIRAGGTAVNDAIIQCLGYEAPFGGSADSGVGSRNAREGILKYTEPHTIMVTRFGLKRDVNWFPNSKRITKLLEAVLSRYYGR
ncbi:MAG TPA: aldehyde dehydrogenase family protein [Thermoleophilaceae bacterium]